ncbi:MAG: hypothetical protein PWP65_971, partial [Clostridia bacterium]|nr:hypothetical protein [Clostridia bacterium]
GKDVEFELVDEHYFVDLYSDVEIFLWSESEDGINATMASTPIAIANKTGIWESGMIAVTLKW